MNKINISALVGGTVFGLGLSVSTMISPEVVLSFLQFRDFGLLLVLGSAVLVALLAYSIFPRLVKKPVCGEKFGRHHDTFNKKILIGRHCLALGGV